jgi:hypothetical protein
VLLFFFLRANISRDRNFIETVVMVIEISVETSLSKVLTETYSVTLVEADDFLHELAVALSHGEIESVAMLRYGRYKGGLNDLDTSRHKCKVGTNRGTWNDGCPDGQHAGMGAKRSGEKKVKHQSITFEHVIQEQDWHGGAQVPPRDLGHDTCTFAKHETIASAQCNSEPHASVPQRALCFLPALARVSMCLSESRPFRPPL